MPTTDNPTVYTRADGIMPGKYDTFFKWAAQEPNDDFGDVDSPVGYVSLLHLTFEDIDLISAEMKHDGHAADIPPKDRAVYITRQDSNGLIWAMSYKRLADALADFKEAEKVWNDWQLAQDEEE